MSNFLNVIMDCVCLTFFILSGLPVTVGEDKEKQQEAKRIRKAKEDAILQAEQAYRLAEQAKALTGTLDDCTQSIKDLYNKASAIGAIVDHFAAKLPPEQRDSTLASVRKDLSSFHVFHDKISQSILSARNSLVQKDLVKAEQAASMVSGPLKSLESVADLIRSSAVGVVEAFAGIAASAASQAITSKEVSLALEEAGFRGDSSFAMNHSNGIFALAHPPAKEAAVAAASNLLAASLPSDVDPSELEQAILRAVNGDSVKLAARSYAKNATAKEAEAFAKEAQQQEISAQIEQWRKGTKESAENASAAASRAKDAADSMRLLSGETIFVVLGYECFASAVLTFFHYFFNLDY